ncbi:hypothetical protein K470DRAFT_256806 [Piedraia hortae CBS 480.64]|uniref:Mitochondrial K+-H+ exchange-related-domain-containing protein n=1 Tax=Piedraia hortae CBS 480.64 TaxID=1314780 RepID=A0A6A7C4N8_9PEZI|nr:hypothetical protein K470DRAFT_256806 [Piedraia hortae CBS 480.64]
MRLFLLPVSTRRSLVYCERARAPVAADAKLPVTERATRYASQTWAKWESAEKGWQKHVTVYGNRLLNRIPYTEWGLKSLPPATDKRRQAIDDGSLTVDCFYPRAFLPGGADGAIPALEKLATERQALDRRRLWSCVFWTPFTIPFQIVPVLPNLPFYYVVYRAYSYYRSLYGGKLLEQLLQKQRVNITDSQLMDNMYAAGLLHPTRPVAREAETPTADETTKLVKDIERRSNAGEEVMLLRRWNGKLIAEAFGLPEMEVEIERAVDQIEADLRAKAEGKAREGQEAAEKGTVAKTPMHGHKIDK